jgi:hypothetical protein
MERHLGDIRHSMASAAYIGWFFLKVSRGLMRRQRISISDKLLSPIYVPCSLTWERVRKWYELYGGCGDECEFTYLTQEFQECMLKVLYELGVNYANILHLSHQRYFFARGLVPGQEYILSFQITDIAIMTEGKAIITLDIKAKDQQGQLAYHSADRIFCRKISTRDMEHIRSCTLSREADRDPQEFKGLSRRKAQLAAHHPAVTAFFAEDLGLRFGLVSGDLNPVHTIKYVAPAFGYEKPFVQGLYVANYVLRHLTVGLGKRLENMAITFCNPVVLGQNITLRYADSQFELLDQTGKLLAFGEWQITRGVMIGKAPLRLLPRTQSV